MNMMKHGLAHRVFALLLALVMVIGMLPITAGRVEAVASEEGEPAIIAEGDGTEGGEGEEIPEEDPEIEDVTLSGKTVTYNKDKSYKAEELVEVTGDKAGDDISYAFVGISDTEVKNAGEYTIAVTVERDGYKTLSKNVKATIKPETIAGISITKQEFEYAGTDKALVTLKGNLAGYDVTWEVNGTEVEGTEIPKAKAVGEYKVKLIVSAEGGNKYFEQEVTSIIKAKTLNVGNLKVTPVQNAVFTVENGVAKEWKLVSYKNKGDFTLSFQLDGGAWSEDIPVASNAGTYVVKAQATKEGHKTVEVGEWEITIAKAEQKLAFNNNVSAVQLSKTASENVYDFSATGENMTGKDIVYTLEQASSDAVAEIHAATGEVTFSNAGVVTVVATREGNDNYTEAKAYLTVTVTVAKDGLVQFLGANGTVVSSASVVRGESKDIYELSAKKANEDDNGTLTYSIDKTDVGLGIDNNGKITVKGEKKLAKALKSGYIDVVVTVKKAAGTVTNVVWDWSRWQWKEETKVIYPEASASYTLRISYAAAPAFDTVCKIAGTNEYGWYNNKDNDNDKGYPATITVIKESISNEDGSTTEGSAKYLISLDPDEGYAESVTLTGDGKNEHTIYLYDVANKRPAAPIVLSNIQIDTQAPTELRIEYSKPETVWPEPKTVWDKVLYFFNPSVDVTFIAKDATSGMDTFQWKYTMAEGAIGALETKSDTVIPRWDATQGAYVATVTLTAKEAEQYRGNLSFTALDKAGNSAGYTDSAKTVVVDTINPKVTVAYAGKKNEANERYYYQDKVDVTITVDEANFFEDDITVSMKKNGEDFNFGSVKWNYDSESQKNIGTFTIDATDGDYVLELTGADKAGNKIITEEYCKDITIDTKNPVVEIKTTTDGLEDVTTDQTQEITIQVTEHNFTAAGITADVTGVNIKGEAVTVKAAEILAYMQIDDNWDEDKDNPDVHTLVLKSTGEGEDNLLVDAIYSMTINCTDLAGRTADEKTLADFYVDHTPPTGVAITFSQPIVDTLLNNLTLGFYKPSVTVTFTAYDEISGVKEFDWRYHRHADASTSNLEKENGTLTAVQDGSDESKFTASVTLTAEQAKHYRGNLFAFATDKRSNNNAEETNPYVAVVDVVAPNVTAGYNEATNVVGDISYYNTDIDVTITVEEINFFAEDVVVEVTRNGSKMTVTPTWTPAGQDLYKGVFSLKEDGDYKVHITYTDKSTNFDEQKSTYTSKQLTIDKTPPVIGVSYNNNAVANGKYFNAPRTATVTITEHNFDVNRVKITNTAARGGVIPVASWSHSGDTHVATLAYTVDGDYTFDISMTDLATNANNGVGYGNSAAGTDFVVDTTYEEMISYEGVENGKAYGDKATVIPSIEIADINLDNWVITLVGKQLGKTTDLTDKVKGLMNDQNTLVTGKLDLFKAVQELDGIYTLTMTGTDLAGNIDTEEVIFTVNRFGSVYDFDKTLTDLVANGGAYVQTVPEDLVITEYNADKLLPGSVVIEITRDGKPLDKVIFDVTPDVNDQVKPGETGWYQYTYRISKDNFLADGIYKIYISSKDATGNTPANGNYEDKVMTFRVDATAPEITSVVGLEEAVINAQEVTVKYTIYDTIGLKSIKIFVDGQLVGTEIVDFGSDPNNYESSFTLYEKAASQHVQILVEDLAGNATDTDDENFESAYVFNKNVTVSTNFFVRWYAQTGLFWGSIAGILALIAALFFFIFGKKKKEEAAA